MGVGMGAGVGMGQILAAAMTGSQNSSPQAPSTPASTIASRLKQLKDLHEQGLIDADAFAAKRDAILAEI